MRIGMDATALYGRFGGIENSIWHLLSELRILDTQNDYLVWVPADAPEPPEPPNARWQWRRLPFPGAAKARRIVWQQLQLPFWLRRERCDILHSLNYVMPLAAPVPTVLTIYDLIALNHARFATTANRIHYRAIMPQSLRRAARVVVTAPQIAAEVALRVPDGLERVRTVPLGVDELFFASVPTEKRLALRAKYRLPEKFCLFVGNFEPKKNLPNLLRAFDLLQASVPDSPPLVVAGGVRAWPGHEKSLGHVQLLGYVEREELAALFAECTLFCFPSLREGFGLPVLEALACGAPVVASPAVPLPALDEVAALAPPRAPAAIAAALERLVGDPELRENMSARGRIYAREFTWKRTAERTLAVYGELDGARSSP